MSFSQLNTYNDPCRQIVIGLVDRDVADCGCLQNFESTLARCSSADIDSGYYWLRLIQSFIHRPTFCNQSIFRFNFYTERSESMTDELHLGNIDLYPIQLRLTTPISRNITFVKQLFKVDYFFYARLERSSAKNAFFEASFVSAPFTTSTWCCVVATILIAVLLQTMIDALRRQKRARNLKFDRFYTLGVTLPIALICLAYSSSLRALFFAQSEVIPFRNLFELADRLRRNELQLLLESDETVRHALLVEESLERREEWRYLYAELQRSPYALRLVERMDEICQLMKSSGKFVFLGYDDLLFGNCKDICFWKHPVVPDQSIYFTYFLPRYSRLLELANLATEAMPNYLEIMTKRRAPKACYLPYQREPIKLGTLTYAFAFVGGFWVIGSIIFIIEVLHSRSFPGLS